MSPNDTQSSQPNGPKLDKVATADLNSQYETREIPLDLIDPPFNPERETMEEEELADLALSIQEVGLIKPLVVKPKGDRFEVIAGHRRLLACTLVKYSPIPCRIKVRGSVDPLAILIAENAHTEAVNPIEEARFYERVLFELCEGDVDMLVVRIKRRRDYLEDRLNLLRGHPPVVKALEDKKISIAVARELNKERDPSRLLVFLDAAANQGATARQVGQWRRDGELQGAIPLAPECDMGPDGNPVRVPLDTFMRCVLCEGNEFPSMMEMLWVHKPCKVMLRRLLGHAADKLEAPEA